MFAQKNVCPKCGKVTPAGSNFCPHCGEGLDGGVRRCGSCGFENVGDAMFCGGCGRALAVAEAPEIQGHRWARPEGDFAVRIEADDLRGLLKRGIKVEPGTNTMILNKGVSMGVMPPGEYMLGTISQTLFDRVTGGIPERITALLVDVTPVEMTFHVGGRFTKDPLPVGVSLRLQVEVADPAKFLVNVLKGQERISIEAVREFIYPEVHAVSDRWLKQHTLQELAEDLSQPARLELAVEEKLRSTFLQSGLRFLQARTVELNLEPFDQIQGKYSRAKLLDTELQAELRLADANLKAAEQRARTQGESDLLLEQVRQEYETRKQRAQVEARKQFQALQQENDLLGLQEDTRKVEQEERRVDLYQRMRQAATTNRMNEVRSGAEFDRFLDEIDLEKLLREKEREDLKRAWREAGQDHELARAHLLARLDIERDFELRSEHLKLQSGLDAQQAAADEAGLNATRRKLQSELELARLRADAEFDLRRKTVQEELWLEQEKERIALEREKNRQEQERVRKLQETQDLEAQTRLGLELLALMKTNRRLDEEERLRIQREHTLAVEREHQRMELEKMEATWRIELARRETDERARQTQREFELQMVGAKGALGIEALIATSGPEQARVLADLKRSENLKGLSEEQIMALAAERSPEVARALEAKYRSIAEGKASEHEIEIYERLVKEIKENRDRNDADAERRARETAEASERNARLIQESHNHAIDRMAETAQAFARSQGGNLPQIVILPDGGGAPIITGSASNPTAPASAPAGSRVCMKCGRFIPLGTAFCQFCGEKTAAA